MGLVHVPGLLQGHESKESLRLESESLARFPVRLIFHFRQSCPHSVVSRWEFRKEASPCDDSQLLPNTLPLHLLLREARELEVDMIYPHLD